MSAIQNHKTLWRKKRQCCYAKDVKGIPKTARHVKIAESKCRLIAESECRLIAESKLPNGCSLHILCRYVDNIFCACDSKDEMDKFFHNLNKVHASVGFSKEVEADGQLTYLDVLLTKKWERSWNNYLQKKYSYRTVQQMGKLVANTIYKKCHKSLLHRSYQICSSYQLIYKEFQHIKSCFLSNGYPDWFIDRQIKIFLNKRYKNTPSKNKQERTTDIWRILLYMPYLGEASVQLEKELRNFFRKYLKEFAHLSLVHRTHTIGDHFKYKDKQAHLGQTNKRIYTHIRIISWTLKIPKSWLLLLTTVNY